MMHIARLFLLGLITKAAQGVGSCPRPGGWCGHAGSFFMNKEDCDGDNKPDLYCFDNDGYTGFRSSKHNCAETWWKGSCAGRKFVSKKGKQLCPRPAGWCKHAGAKYSDKEDCDGDFIPDPYCVDSKNTKGSFNSGAACTDSWGKGKACIPPRARAISPGYHLCANRAGLGRNNSYSTNVGPENLPGCIAYVHNKKGCGSQFNYGTKDGWCDCVTTAPCIPAYNNNVGIYATYTLMGRTIKSPLNLMANYYLCENRGSVGGKGDYSVKMSAHNLQACANWVESETKCGPFFSYGLKDGYCDCVPAGKGQCKLYTDANTQKSEYGTYSQVRKIVTFGANNKNHKKCVKVAGMECAKNAGDKGIRVNGDHKEYNDKFIITTTATEVCAKRVGSNTWGMNLQIRCAFKNIPAYQANFVTSATHHLCLNRGSIGGKGLYSKPNKGANKFAECEAWVRNNKACGTHFNYGWKDGYCDCVPKKTGFCKLYTDATTIKSEYSAYEIYTTTTTPPPPTPKPTPRPPPPKVKGLKSAMGWTVSKGKCTIDISAGVVCAVSSNYPKKYFRDELCQIDFTNKEKKKTERLDVQMNGEKYFDILKIDGQEYHGTVKRKIPIKSKKFTWSSDFWEEAKGPKIGWKICKTAPAQMKLDEKKKGKGKGKKAAKGKGNKKKFMKKIRR